MRVTDSRLLVPLLALLNALVIISTNEMGLLIEGIAQIIASTDADQCPMTEMTSQTMLVKDAVFVNTQVTLVHDRQAAGHAILLAQQQRVLTENIVVDQ